MRGRSQGRSRPGASWGAQGPLLPKPKVTLLRRDAWGPRHASRAPAMPPAAPAGSVRASCSARGLAASSSPIRALAAASLGAFTSGRTPVELMRPSVARQSARPPVQPRRRPATAGPATTASPTQGSPSGGGRRRRGYPAKAPGRFRRSPPVAVWLVSPFFVPAWAACASSKVPPVAGLEAAA